MSLQASLPPQLQGPATTITPLGARASGAAVHRVEAAGQSFMLKISGEELPLPVWQRKRRIQQLAAEAGLAPQVVHVDETRRAVLSALITDRSFPSFYANPATREAALLQLGRTLRRVHQLPLLPGMEAGNPRDFLGATWARLTDFALPAFVADAVGLVQSETAPAPERELVLSHNDVNPTNLIYDGENLLLFDWETASPNDPFYDLAAIAVFLRMDEECCRKLLAAYDGAPVTSLPPRFMYDRRVVAVLCGAVFLHLARQSGHPGADGTESLDTTPSLLDFYKQLWSGSRTVASADGQWGFGMALMKTSLAL